MDSVGVPLSPYAQSVMQINKPIRIEHKYLKKLPVGKSMRMKKQCPNCQRICIGYFDIFGVRLNSTQGVCPRCNEVFQIQYTLFRDLFSLVGGIVSIGLAIWIFGLRVNQNLLVWGLLILGGIIFFDYWGFLKITKVKKIKPFKKFIQPYNNNEFAHLLSELREKKRDFITLYSDNQTTYLDIFYKNDRFYLNLSLTTENQHRKKEYFKQTSSELALELNEKSNNEVDYLEVKLSNSIQDTQSTIYRYADTVFQRINQNEVNIMV